MYMMLSYQMNNIIYARTARAFLLYRDKTQDLAECLEKLYQLHWSCSGSSSSRSVLTVLLHVAK